MRFVAMRGAFTLQTRPNLLVPLIPANLRIRLQLAQSDYTDKAPRNDTSFAMLFSDESSPWYWFASPPRMRTGDLLNVTLRNAFSPGEGTPVITPEFAVRFIDDALWELLYAADRAAEEGRL